MRQKLVFLLTALLLPLAICAYDGYVELDDLHYITFTESKTAVIVGAADVPHLVVPSVINYYGEEYSVVGIGDEALRKHDEITTIELPNTIEFIRDRAFQDCIKLKKINLPKNVSLNGACFSSCTSLDSISIPSGAVFGDGGTFTDCTNLQSVTIASQTMAKQMFVRCTALKSITFMGHIESIPNGAFMECSSLESFVIPESVTSIEEHAFHGCINLSSITIPSSVCSIGDLAFYDCTNLSIVTSNIEVPFPIGEHVFGRLIDGISWAYPTTLYVPKGTKKKYQETAGWNVFSSIVEMEGDIPNDYDTFTGQTLEGIEMTFTILSEQNKTCMVGVDNTGKTWQNAVSAINNATMGKMTIPAEVNGYKVTSIGDYAFYNCKVSEVGIPEGITSIAACAFANCPITTVTLPSTLAFIGTNAFTQLTSIYCYVVEPFELSEKAFNYAKYQIVDGDNTTHYYYTANLYIPKGTKQKYAAIATWNKFQDNGDRIFEMVSAEKEAYAVYTDGKLSFYYDENQSSRSGIIYTAKNFRTTVNDGWYEVKADIQSVTFDDSFVNYHGITNTGSWFRDCTQLATINGLENLNTENVTKMWWMFASCESLQSLDLSHFETSKVIEIEGLFYRCKSLRTIDLSSFDTSNIEGMISMFQGCVKLETIYASSKWSTEKVISGDDMFKGCTRLVGGKGTKYDANYVDATYARIDKQGLPGYFTDKNTSIGGETTAYAILCYEEKNNDSFYFLTSNDNIVAGAEYKGKYIIRLWKGIDVENSGTGPVWRTEFLDELKKNVKSVIFEESFISATPVSCENWFMSFENLESVTGLEYLNTSKTTSMNCMFYGCSNLKNIDISKLTTGSVTNMGHMFHDCSSLTKLDLSNFKTDNVTSMAQMFQGCSKLVSLDLGHFNTSNVIHMQSMFDGCSSLSDMDVTSFNTSKVKFLNTMFNGCSSLTTLDLSSFNTSTVTGMYGTFQDCTNLKTIYVGNGWTTENVTLGDDMFKGCTSLVGGNSTKYDVDHVDATYAHIDGGSANPGYLTCINDGSTSLDPIEDETVVSTDNLGNADLSDNVVNDVYYNVGDEGYDPTDNSIVIGETTNMGQINDPTPGSDDVKNNFAGLILKVAAGKGTITVNVKTTGNAQLVVQVGNGTPIIASKTEQGDVVVGYDVTEDTYVYIYAIIGSSNVRTRGDSENLVKIFSISIKSGGAILGDANGDGVVDDKDIVEIVNYLMGKPSDKFNKIAADVNSDNVVNTTDIVNIVNMLQK